MKRAQERGGDTVLRMACGLQDLMRDGEGEEKEALERIQEFLDDFYQVCTRCDYGRAYAMCWTSVPPAFHSAVPLEPTIPIQPTMRWLPCESVMGVEP